MMKRFHHFGYVAAIVTAGAMSGFAQAQATRPIDRPVPRIKGEAATIAEINEQLASTDPAVRQQAVEAIRQRMRTRTLAESRLQLRNLLTAKMYKEVADLSLEGILSFPGDTRSVEAVLQLRIKALLSLGQADQAMAESKSLFNISSMIGTSEAILAVAECLNVAKAADVELFNRFREEQMAGATLPTTIPANGIIPPRKCLVLAAIKVNSKVYDDVLLKMTGEDPATLMARGNLLLMADRVKEARAIFERMYSLASADLIEASEALARCMKAEDGTVGRANAWILSIRPQATPVRRPAP